MMARLQGWDGTVNVKENNYNKPQDISINVSPNPFNLSCVITVPANADVKIYDLQGNVVYTHNVGGERRSHKR